VANTVIVFAQQVKHIDIENIVNTLCLIPNTWENS